MKLILIPKIAVGIVKTTVGTIVGYLSFCLITYTYYFFRGLYYHRGMDAEGAAFTCIGPLAIIDALVLNDWKLYFLYARPNYRVWYFSIGFWIWVFFRRKN